MTVKRPERPKGKPRGASLTPERAKELVALRRAKAPGSTPVARDLDADLPPQARSGPAKPDIVTFTTQTLGLPLSAPQKTLLQVIYGEALTTEEREIYARCTGRSGDAYVSGQPFSTITVVSGAQSGKDSRIACPVVCYEAVHGGHERYFVKGQPVRIVLVAQDKDAAGIAYGYIRAAFERPDRKS